jgi:hypothetical protein
MSDGDSIVRWVALAVLTGGIVWLLWRTKMTLPGASSGRLSRLRATILANQGIIRRRESIRLTPQHSLHLVEFGPRQLLVACHPAGATLISGHVGELPETGKVNQ